MWGKAFKGNKGRYRGVRGPFSDSYSDEEDGERSMGAWQYIDSAIPVTRWWKRNKAKMKSRNRREEKEQARK